MFRTEIDFSFAGQFADVEQFPEADWPVDGFPGLTECDSTEFVPGKWWRRHRVWFRRMLQMQIATNRRAGKIDWAGAFLSP